MAMISAFQERMILTPRKDASSTGALVVAVLASVLLFTCSTAFAQSVNKVVQFDIKPQTLDSALLEFGRQAHIQIMFATKIAAGPIRTPEIKGGYTAAQVLAILLRRTGLTYSNSRNSIEVTPIRSRTIRITKMRTNIASKHATHSSITGTNDPSLSSSQKKALPPRVLKKVIITGSRLPTTSKYGPQEVQIYNLTRIESSGQTSVSNFLSTLPSVSTASSETAFGTIPTVQLRGLPVGTTLVLLNGRRIENSGLSRGDYFNLNNIPLAAVQRIEVDENGSSAVYGSDAIAGVINIILKKHFRGFEANAKYGWAKDTDTVRTDVAWGRQWGRAGLSVIGSYGIDSGLLFSQRQLSANNDYRKLGGPDNNFPICFPGNIFSINGAPLPGAPTASSGTYAAVTGSTVSGKPALSQFAYGMLNECSLGAGAALLPSRHRAGVLVHANLMLTRAVMLFSELMYTHVSQVLQFEYQSLFGLPGFQEFSVSAANPYNPFGTTVGVALSLHDVPSAEIYDTDFFRPLLGIKGTIAARWHWEIAAWQSSDWSQDTITNDITNYGAIQNALNSSNPATAINPFVSGPPVPRSIVNALFTDGKEKVTARDRSAEAFIRGPVLHVPAGTINAVIGVDYVRSALAFNEINNGIDPPNTRSVYTRRYYAMFGEAHIPILSRNDGAKSLHLLSLTISARRDHYSDFGTDRTAQFGVELRPTRSLLIRGAYGDAFAAPTLTALQGPRIVSQGLITDPKTGLPAVVPILTGGNPRLRPITGHSHTIGIVYSSQFIRGLVISATQWNISENNTIQTLAPQVIVDNFPANVVRDSTGAITQVIDTNVNYGTIDVSGIDYLGKYHKDIGPGMLSITLDATETYKYKQALLPGAPQINAVSKAQDSGDWAPRWKGAIGMRWTDGGFSAALAGRYTGPYLDYNSTRRIGNFWIFDTNLRWRIGKLFDSQNRWLTGDTIGVGATNLLNTAPQFSNFTSDFYGFDAAQMSIVGRVLYVDVGIDW